jgi:hypothetical protein
MKSYQRLDENNYVLESEDPKHHKFYKDQNHCCFCGHELEIKAVKKTGQVHLREEGHCPSCNEFTIIKRHNIQ